MNAFLAMPLQYIIGQSVQKTFAQSAISAELSEWRILCKRSCKLINHRSFDKLRMKRCSRLHIPVWRHWFVRLFVFLGLGFLHTSAWAQEATLYATAIQSKGYVAGAKLTGSGLIRRDNDSTWTHLGHNNPRVIALTYDPAHPDTMFIAGGNGVLRTYDGGGSWRITTDWRVTEVRDVALDPNAPQHVYTSTPYGVWRSVDLGKTWIESNTGIPVGKTYTEALEVDRTQAHRVLAGTNDGVYLSTNGAQSWARAGGAGFEILDLQQSRGNPHTWLAATYQNGILLSTDNGKTWAASGPRDLADKSVHGVAINPFNPHDMAVAGWDTGVYVSENGGHSWQQRGQQLPTKHFYEIIYDANVEGRLWAATLEEGLYYSDDQGRTWMLGGLNGTLVFDMLFVYPPSN